MIKPKPALNVFKTNSSSSYSTPNTKRMQYANSDRQVIRATILRKIRDARWGPRVRLSLIKYGVVGSLLLSERKWQHTDMQITTHVVSKTYQLKGR